MLQRQLARNNKEENQLKKQQDLHKKNMYDKMLN